MRTTMIACLLLLFAVPQVQAGVAANPTRPTFSDNAHPMAKGYIEF
jgi:P pilus assembly chaperone PapD